MAKKKKRVTVAHSPPCKKLEDGSHMAVERTDAPTVSESQMATARE
jgi:hypothetical protein